MNNSKIEAVIRHEFEDLTLKYDFQVTTPLKVIDQVCLENGKCMIRFTYDMGIVECDFVDPIEKKKKESIGRADGMPAGFPIYPVYAIWEFLYPNDKIDFRYSGYDIKEQISAFKKVITSRLHNVLKGDFTWAMPYKIKDNRMTKKIEYMMKYFNDDNPVLMKFRDGDPNWEKEFDEYKNYLDNL